MVHDDQGDLRVQLAQPADLGVLAGDQALVGRRERRDQRVFGRQHEVRRAEDGVRPRREHAHRQVASRHRVAALGRKTNLGALGFADPVPLRGLGRVRPIQAFQIGQESGREPRDGEEPLFQEPLFHLRATPLAFAVDDLLVGQHRLVERAPIDRGLLAVCQSAIVELEKDPLRPAVVLGVGGLDRVAPIHHQPGLLKLAAEVGDVARDQDRRVNADFEGVVLRMDPERVVAKRLEDRASPHPMVPAVDVVAGKREQVPHVQPFGRRIGEHHQRVELVRAGADVGGVRPAAPPAVLPLRLDDRRIVALRHRHARVRNGWGRSCGHV